MTIRIRRIVCEVIVCSVMSVAVFAKEEIEKTVRIVDQKVQLLPQLQTNAMFNILPNIQDISRWPSEDDMMKFKVKVDRSDPVVGKNGKRIDTKRTLMLNSEGACFQAAHCINILKKEWFADNMNKLMIPLQKDPPSRSLVACRYEINETIIQFVQNRSCEWVTIRPTTNLVTVRDSRELGPVVFKMFFAKGDIMSKVPFDEVEQKNGLRVFVRQKDADVTAVIGEEYVNTIYCPQMWYTDGKSVSVLLLRRGVNSPTWISTDEGWF